MPKSDKKAQRPIMALLDIIGQIRSDSAVFLFNDAGSPTLVKDEGDTRALYVLMPMRV